MSQQPKTSYAMTKLTVRLIDKMNMYPFCAARRCPYATFNQKNFLIQIDIWRVSHYQSQCSLLLLRYDFSKFGDINLHIKINLNINYLDVNENQSRYKTWSIGTVRQWSTTSYWNQIQIPFIRVNPWNLFIYLLYRPWWNRKTIANIRFRKHFAIYRLTSNIRMRI